MSRGCSSFHPLLTSDHDPLDLIERDLVSAPVVEPGRPRRLVRGHLLSNFELTAVREVRGNARCAECMATDQCLDAGARGASPDHEVNFRLGDPPFREVLGFALSRAEEGSAFLAGAASGIEISSHVFLKIVVRRHLVALATLLMQPHPPAPSLEVPILDIHSRGGAYASEGEPHEADESAVAEADDGGRVDGVQELSRLLGRAR